jgi:hypothetical protein
LRRAHKRFAWRAARQAAHQTLSSQSNNALSSGHTKTALACWMISSMLVSSNDELTHGNRMPSSQRAIDVPFTADMHASHCASGSDGCMTDVGQQTTISPSLWQLPLVATLRLGNTERFRKTVCQQLKQLKCGARPSCSPQKVTLRCACIPDLA